MTRKIGLLVGLGLTLGAAPGAAQTMGQLQWLGTGTSFAATFLRQDNSQITAYAGAAYRANAVLPGTAPWYLQNSNGFGPAVDIYCIDFLHTARTTTYNAWFTNLGRDALTYTRGATLGQYQQVAWLTDQMDMQNIGTAAGRQQRAVIHAAIWQIMNGAGQPRAARTGSYGFETAGITNWIQLAGLNSGSVDMRNWTVVTDASCAANPAGCGQEFLVRDNTVTPEPITLVLLGTGLLAMAGMAFVTRGGLG